MSLGEIDPRPASPAERALVARLLDVAIDPEAAEALRAQVDRLKVVARCECGCPSVVFGMPAGMSGERRVMVADAYGTAPEGYAVGLLLWTVGGYLEYLEMYTLGDWPPHSLPAPDTVTTEYPSTPPVV